MVFMRIKLLGISQVNQEAERFHMYDNLSLRRLTAQERSSTFEDYDSCTGASLLINSEEYSSAKVSL